MSSATSEPVHPIRPRQTVSEAIDEMIRENPAWERPPLLWVAVLTLVGVGLAIAGAVNGNGVLAAAGTPPFASAAVILRLAMRNAAKVREENQKLRALAASCLNTKTDKEAAAILALICSEHFIRGEGDVVPRT